MHVKTRLERLERLELQRDGSQQNRETSLESFTDQVKLRNGECLS